MDWEARVHSCHTIAVGELALFSCTDSIEE